MVSGLRQRLKDATTADHQRLDAHPRLQALLAPGLPNAIYGALLHALLAWYTPLELHLINRLDSWRVPLALDRRRKTGLLERDLRVLGLGDHLTELAPDAALPMLDCRPAALGCMYVLEGATLGGQMIARQLQQNAGMTITTGSAFFHSYGPEVGSLWHAFGLFLDQCPEALEKRGGGD